MAKSDKTWSVSPMEKRIADMLARAVERLEGRRAFSRSSDPFALRVFGVFDPNTARIVSAFPTQYYACQYVRNSKRPLYIYCFDFVSPLPTSLY